MKVLIMNAILYTAETDHIPKVKSIKDTMIYALCMGFVKNGDVPVLAAADVYRPVEEEDYPFEIVWFPCRWPRVCKPRCLPWLKGLSGYLKRHREEFDYIISSEVFSLLTLSGALWGRDRLIIWHELGAHNNMLKKLPSRFWYHIVARLFFQNIPVVPRSKKAEDFIRQYSNRVLEVTIDHGVDLEKIEFCRNKEDYFVVVSQLIERKHIDGIIENFADFLKQGKEGYGLKIIGDGVLRKNLEEQAKRLGIEKQVAFLGKQNHEQLMPVLARARALLVNTGKDNSMVSIVESIAAGTPVVTTTVPFNAAYIKSAALGIVKDGWGAAELLEICTKNRYYVENCISYREKLGNVYFAKQFDQIGGT